MKDLLSKHLKDIGNLPYLFVGSGFSKRYIGMESWEDLLEAVTVLATFPRPFTYYLTECGKDYPVLGSLLAEAFYTKFYDSDYRTLYPYITDPILKAGDKDTPFKHFIADYIQGKQKQAGISDEIEILKKAKIAGVITTNWDTLLEEMFPDFKCYIGQEMMFAEALNFGELFKIHGSITRPDTMVLTKRDYDDYHVRNAYLAAKLLTIFVEHPIIFVGYSLSDPNILQIINSIFKTIRVSDYEKFKDRLIFIEYDKLAATASFMDGTLSIGDGRFLPIKHIKANDYSPIYEVLQELDQAIPTKVLVRLKHMLYDFVVTNRPNNKIYVGNITDVDDSTLDKIQAVFGVGAAEMFEYGYRSVSPEDIFKDILDENIAFDIDKLLTLTYPTVFKSAQYIPVYKYLTVKGIGTIDQIRTVYTGFDTRLISKLKRITFTKLLPAPNYVAHKPDVNKLQSFSELVSKKDAWHVLLYVHLLDHNKIDLEDFKTFLLENLQKYGKTTDYRKAMCLYDILKHKPSAT
ncbi:SIR2 family protein [Mucilaginibacter sp.]|uniref:SIR2 family protein n=1 Tax=Mucilaginibacter sp. TaxID=1882438 RepID=UPI0035BC94A9